MDQADFFFNVSHSGKWIFLGISNNEIGVDIERITDCDLDIAKRFFTNEEYQDLLYKTLSHRNKLFFQIWSIKESYIKYKGLGLSIPLNSFHCKITKDTIGLITTQDEVLNVRTYLVDKDYSTSTCSIEEPATVVTYITLKQIWNEISLL